MGITTMHELMTAEHPNCYHCGATGVVFQTQVRDPDHHIQRDWTLKRCPQCALVWLDPAPLESELWKAYTAYHTHTRVVPSKFAKAILSLAHRLIKLVLLPVWMPRALKQEAAYLRCMTLDNEPVGKLLDVGCGAGRLLNRMRKLGWEVEGVDFDPQSTHRAAEKYGIKAHTGDLSDCQLPSASFDAITMSQTMEHLFDPRRTLQECLRILKPGGKLIMTTPNCNSMGALAFGRFWRGWEAPRHLHIFTVKNLAELTQQQGFDILEARTCSAGSAVVYRVSATLQDDAPRSLVAQLRLLIWGYQQERAEHFAQITHPHSGQNVLIRAVKPL